MKIDLHIHSTYSDGTFAPEKVVDTAIDCGLDAISITDHDNIMAYKIASEYAKDKPINIIPGVEINTLWNNDEIHILGYYMDLESKDFLDLLLYQQHARINQTVQIVEKLNKIGINVKYENIKSLVEEGGSIGRPHLARAIMNAGGAMDIMEAFARYISDNAPTYIKRKTVPPHEAVEIIYEAGGIPVIAHPHDLEVAESLIKELMNYGLRGIEAYHRKHSPAIVEYYSSMAERLGLIVTGGSDFHTPAPNGNIAMGKTLVPAWVMDDLKKEKERIALAQM